MENKGRSPFPIHDSQPVPVTILNKYFIVLTYIKAKNNINIGVNHHSFTYKIQLTINEQQAFANGL